LEQALKLTTLKASRRGNTLVVKHAKLTTQVAVEPPEVTEAEGATIKAIVTIKTPLGSELNAMLEKPGAMAAFNKLASLAALTEENGGYYIGSRLTVYEGEEAWNLFFGFMLFSVLGGVDTLLQAPARAFAGEPPREADRSLWGKADFMVAERELSRVCFCNASETSLTAEFGLRKGELSVVLGDNRTALWRMDSRQPHPEFGGGLFCLLDMPQSISNKVKLHNVLASLNRHEMTGGDLPPHFGAWCVGSRRDNPAYVSFLPNALHNAGIAINMSIWAYNRAHLADALLQLEGLQ
jgi:hypothetical protein